MLIPGLASSRDTWKATAERLKTRYRLHLIQVAGFAGEPARANAGGEVVTATAEAIDVYLVEQHLTPATVVGHSLGGTMTLYLAEHHPDHLKKAMLVDTLPFFGTLMGGPNATAASMKAAADQVRARKEKMTPAQYDQMMRNMATAPTDLATIKAWGTASDTTVVADAMADDMTLDLRPDLAKITTPITLMHPDYTALGTTARHDGASLQGCFRGGAHGEDRRNRAIAAFHHVRPARQIRRGAGCVPGAMTADDRLRCGRGRR